MNDNITYKCINCFKIRNGKDDEGLIVENNSLWALDSIDLINDEVRMLNINYWIIIDTETLKNNFELYVKEELNC